MQHFRPLRVIILLFIAIVVGFSTAAGAQSIAVSGDLCGFTCAASFPIGQLTTVYVVAIPGGQTRITGAQYRITGFPAEWVVSVEDAPGVESSLGDVFAEGTRVTFAACQAASATTGQIHLQTIHVFATSWADQTMTLVERALPPLDLTHDSPVLESCSDTDPVTLECFSGVFYLNGMDPYCGADCWPAPCPSCSLVAVQHTSWETIKQMYR